MIRFHQASQPSHHQSIPLYLFVWCYMPPRILSQITTYISPLHKESDVNKFLHTQTHPKRFASTSSRSSNKQYAETPPPRQSQSQSQSNPNPIPISPTPDTLRTPKTQSTTRTPNTNLSKPSHRQR
ncbi:hypothetical protein EYC80_009501 [Monilinia laxa]|uniref:Uncharacterized protein n=1 Tax=Monilinia laxa TaxID=61186 RepID=A0A5N6JY07_MONLA|nr:hypothetical protein EYC80_009501 [Monilinia laxa]